jgi:hypothetical protein
MTEKTQPAPVADAAARADRPSRSSRLHAPDLSRLRTADVLLPASLLLWALGVSRTQATTVGPYGLPAALPAVFWMGIGLLLVSAAVELGHRHCSGRRMALHAVALTVMLYGTAPLVYPEGRYSWLYKTVGVVQYINAHGQLNQNIDIYQNWPGFFAFAAWFTKVAGVASPLAYAKWAQLVFELAALPLLCLVYRALGLSIRQRWLAVLLYFGSNWIGQDYFSPQALGTVLSLGIMAIALHWLCADAPAQGRPAEPRARGKFLVMPCVALASIYLVLTFSHELSPYMLIVQLGALAVFRQLRPRWLPALLLAIAVAYLAPHFNFVNSHYGLLNSFGDFIGNASPPAFKAGSVSTAQRLIEHSQELLSLGMWGAALAGAWLRRRQGRTARTAFLLAFSPFSLLALLAYGQEGVLRVYLFSLPWTAALAALALVPFAAATAADQRGQPTADERQQPAAPVATDAPALAEDEAARGDAAAAADGTFPAIYRAESAWAAGHVNEEVQRP